MLELQALNCVPGERQRHRHADLISAHRNAQRLSQRL
jgi:hypothetical protein